MSKKFLLIAILIIFILLLLRHAGTIPAIATEERCPVGSYEIGSKDDVQPICKLEPTGCPYGDSIPMEDCDKHAPVLENEPEEQIPAPAEEPVVYSDTQGK